MDVLVRLGYHNKITQTGQLTNNRNLFLIVLEAGSQRSGCKHIEERAPFWVTYFSLYPHLAKELGNSVGSLIPFVRASSSGPNHLPNSPFPNAITLGIPPCELGRTQTFRPYQWAKINMLAGLHYFWRLWGEGESISLLFSVYRGCLHSLIHDPFLWNTVMWHLQISL